VELKQHQKAVSKDKQKTIELQELIHGIQDQIDTSKSFLQKEARIIDE